MKKLFLFVGLAVIFLLAGCGCLHDWEPATCTEPETCLICGETRGEPLGHEWENATCMEPMHCSICGMTEGEIGSHRWEEPTCAHPYRCEVCGLEVGDTLEHTWTEATYQQAKTCTVCGAVDGEPIPAGVPLLGIDCVTELGQDVPFSTVTLTPGIYTDGTVSFTVTEMISTYNGTPLPEKEGYGWYSIRAEFLANDINTLTYGYSAGCCYGDYYTPEKHDAPTGTVPITETVTANQYTVNWLGEEYPECLDFFTFDKGIVTADGGRLTADYYVRVPVGYDGIVIGFFNNEDAMNQTTALLAECAEKPGVFFRCCPVRETTEEELSEAAAVVVN